MSDMACREVYRGEALSLQVMDRPGVRFCTHSEPYAVISITDPNLEHPALVRSEHCRAVLPIRFYDLEGSVASLRTGTANMGFTAEMAGSIRDFVREQRRNGVDLFVVNCEFGVSRSAGVAAALSFYYNHDETFFLVHFQPNAHVRRLVLEALRADPDTAGPP